MLLVKKKKTSAHRHFSGVYQYGGRERGKGKHTTTNNFQPKKLRSHIMQTYSFFFLSFFQFAYYENCILWESALNSLLGASLYCNRFVTQNVRMQNHVQAFSLSITKQFPLPLSFFWSTAIITVFILSMMVAASPLLFLQIQKRSFLIFYYYYFFFNSHINDVLCFFMLAFTYKKN